MARQPYRPVERTELLQPVATPLNTFVKAQEPSRDTNLQDLARSLSNLGGSLSGLVGQRDREAEGQDKVRAEALYWQSNGTGAAEAISKGLIPAQASPAFLRAYKRLEGEVAGGLLQEKFSSAYDAWPGKTSTDPEAYQKFQAEFLRDNIKTNDPDILAGLNPRVRQLSENFLHRHIGDASRATMAGAVTALSAKQDQALTEANSAGLASAKGTDYGAVFGRLEAIRAEGLGHGMNAEEVDKKLLDTVTARAIDLRDPKLLDFLDRKVPGKDYAWSATPYGREQRQKTLDTLEAMGRRSIADDERRRREEKAEAKDGVTRDTIAAITKDPRAPIPEELLARGEKVDPDFRVNAIRWRDAVGKDAQTSDPEEMLAVTSDILNGGGLPRVQRAMREGVFRNSEDLTKAWKLAEGMVKDGPKLDAVTKLQSFRDLTATIKKRTAGEKDPLAMFDDGSFSPEGLQAMTDLRRQLLQWAQKNPDAGPIEQEEAVASLGAALLKRLPPSDATDRPAYDREGVEGPNIYGSRAPGAEAAQGGPAVSRVPNPMQPDGRTQPEGRTQPSAPAYGNREVQVPSGLPGATEEAAPPAPVPPPQAQPAQPAPQAAQPDGVSAWLNGLSPEQRGRIERKAAEEKKPLLLKAQELYERGVAAGAIKPPAPSAPASPAPGKQSGLRAPDGTPIETASTSITSADGDGIGQAFREAIDAPASTEQVRLLGEAFERAIAGTGKPAGGYVSAQLKDDPKAARILDFVAGPESGGNYNAYFGNARSTKDLSAMTFDQVVAWSRNRGTKSSATGRYQFMADTLKGLKTEMKISGSERFTPELQDRMALQLLNRRGYSRWASGQLSDAQFANNLALEWASLPSITAQNGRPAGVSAYAGDGLNKSLVKPEAVMAALRGGSREAGLGTITPGILGRLFGRKRPSRRPDDDSGETRA